MRILRLLFLLPLCLACVTLFRTDAHAESERRTITLASELPTGDAAVDAVPFDFYPAETASPTGGAASSPAPTIVVLPPQGGTARDPLMHRLAMYAVRHGINAAVMTLPYHGTRWPKAEGGRVDPGLHFLSGDPNRSAQAWAQSASDVTTVVSWLANQPSVDKGRIGVVGISLGAIVAHLAMGRDDRIGVGVAFLGGGDLADMSRHSFFSSLTRFFHPAQRVPAGLDETEIERILHRVDPLTYANENRPRRVFMVQGARDVVIPPRDATKLWNALGRPPIRWIDSSHAGLKLATDSAFRAATEYLQSVWAAPTVAAAASVPTPELKVPTIQLGFVGQTRGRDSLGITPALTYQLTSVGTWADHTGLAHLDLGISGRGPFVAAAVTVTPYIDLGFASRITHNVPAPRLYLNLHVTY